MSDNQNTNMLSLGVFSVQALLHYKAATKTKHNPVLFYWPNLYWPSKIGPIKGQKICSKNKRYYMNWPWWPIGLSDMHSIILAQVYNIIFNAITKVIGVSNVGCSPMRAKGLNGLLRS